MDLEFLLRIRLGIESMLNIDRCLIVVDLALMADMMHLVR